MIYALSYSFQKLITLKPDLLLAPAILFAKPCTAKKIFIGGYKKLRGY